MIVTRHHNCTNKTSIFIVHKYGMYIAKYPMSKLGNKLPQIIVFV